MSSAGSSSRPRVNLRSTAVKRIMQEASELADPNTDDFVAGPLETDIFEWHCTMRGVPGSEYDGGLYHIRIILPPSYPMSAPDIMLMTPNGRFELGKKICIDGLTSFHAGSWQPAWGVRTAITGLRSFWMQGGEALSAIGALDCPREERQRLAKLSCDWVCPTCQVKNSELLDIKPLPKEATPGVSPQVSQESSQDAAGQDAQEERPERHDPPARSERSEPPERPAEPAKTGTLADNTLELTDPTSPEPVSADHPTVAQPSVTPASVAPVQSTPASVTPAPVTEPEPVPAPVSRAQAPQSATTRSISPRPTSRPPLWIDASIFILVSILAILIARRFA